MDYSALVSAIDELGKSSGVDYFVAFSPIIISLIALIFSFTSTANQNRIALFEKRHAVYSDLIFFRQFAEDVCVDGPLKDQPLDYIAQRWGISLNGKTKFQVMSAFGSCFRLKEGSIAQAQFLFGSPRSKLKHCVIWIQSRLGLSVSPPKITPEDISKLLNSYKAVQINAISLHFESMSDNGVTAKTKETYHNNLEQYLAVWNAFQDRYWDSILDQLRL